MFEKLKELLFGEYRITDNHKQDLELLEEIAGAKFEKIPEIYLLSKRKIPKRILNSGGSNCYYNELENKVYIGENLKKNPYEFDFELAHECGHALFAQNSLAKKELEEEKLQELEKKLNRKLSKKEIKKCLEGNIVYISPEFYDYLFGKIQEPNFTFKEQKECLERFTLNILDQAFASLLARRFLIAKYGKDGLIPGIEFTNYDLELIKKLPSSEFKLELVLLSAGALYGNHLSDDAQALKKLLNMRKEDLSKVRNEIIKVYSKAINFYEK
jgi:hypothetical protein